MKIFVTEKDIKLGMKTSRNMVSQDKCPVARAIKGAKLKGILVGVNWASSIYGQIVLSKKVSNAIEAMCQGRKMKPFNFTLTKKQINVLMGQNAI